MGAFLYIISKWLSLSCGLPLSMDFSLANWEVIWQVLEVNLEDLLDDDTICTNDEEHVSKMQFHRALGMDKPLTFAPAIQGKLNSIIITNAGQHHNIPHDYYIDNGIYVAIYDKAMVK